MAPGERVRSVLRLHVNWLIALFAGKSPEFSQKLQA